MYVCLLFNCWNIYTSTNLYFTNIHQLYEIALSTNVRKQLFINWFHFASITVKRLKSTSELEVTKSEVSNRTRQQDDDTSDYEQ